MDCPACEEHIGWEWVEEAAIEPNEEFDCPGVKKHLMYTIDEGTYYGAQRQNRRNWSTTSVARRIEQYSTVKAAKACHKLHSIERLMHQ
ncbi:hypothetical protein OK016_30035 [Vibrio chagasii]|nr:hypothetical protein [Vibrio chagasii]